MTVGAWICLVSPLVSAVLITLLGTRIPRRAAGVIATGLAFVAFGGALTMFFASLGEGASERQDVTVAWTWLRAGIVDVQLSLLVDPLSIVMALMRSVAASGCPVCPRLARVITASVMTPKAPAVIA